MEFKSIGMQVDLFIRDQGGYWDTPWLLAAITEELGELSRVLQIYTGIKSELTFNRKNSIKESIEEEIGDLLFALICLANYFDIDLEIAVMNTLKKYKTRETEK